MADGPGGPGGDVRAQFDAMGRLRDTVQGMAREPSWMPNNAAAAWRPSNFAESGLLQQAINNMSQSLQNYHTDYSSALNHNGAFVGTMITEFGATDAEGRTLFDRLNAAGPQGANQNNPTDPSRLLDVANNANPVTTREYSPLQPGTASGVPDLENANDPAARQRGWMPGDDDSFWGMYTEGGLR